MGKKMENEMETEVIMGYIRVILGLYWDFIGVILGLYRNNGKENGNYYVSYPLG